MRAWLGRGFWRPASLARDASVVAMTPVFDQYLRHADLPTLELAFLEGGQLAYRWRADVKAFAMPIKVGRKDAWQAITP